MPFEVEEFNETHSTLKHTIVSSFEEKVKNLAQYEVIYKLRTELQNQIQDDFVDRTDRNDSVSE